MSRQNMVPVPPSAPEGDAAVPTLATPAEFTDRVMAQISVLPMPTPTRTFLSSMRERAIRDAIAAFSVAWHLGTVRGWPVAPRVRARSFALVLAVVSVLATGSLAAAAAVRVVAPPLIERLPAAAGPPPGVDEPGPIENGQTESDDPGGATDGSGVPSTVDQPDETDDAGNGPNGADEQNVTDHRNGGKDGAHERDGTDEPGGAPDGADQPDQGDQSGGESDGADQPEKDAPEGAPDGAPKAAETHEPDGDSGGRDDPQPDAHGDPAANDGDGGGSGD